VTACQTITWLATEADQPKVLKLIQRIGLPLFAFGLARRKGLELIGSAGMR
jgi:hypothetical protein